MDLQKLGHAKCAHLAYQSEKLHEGPEKGGMVAGLVAATHREVTQQTNKCVWVQNGCRYTTALQIPQNNLSRGLI